MENLIKDTIHDMVINFLVYDRKGDKDLPYGAIEAAIKAGDINTSQIIHMFSEELMRRLNVKHQD